MRKDRYELCKKLIGKGQWQIDLEKGIVIGKRGSHGRPNNSGYLEVGVTIEGKCVNFLVHEIIAVAGGLNPTDATIDHINSNNQDNRFCNLQVLSLFDNLSKGAIGSKRAAKITESDAYNIRQLLSEGMTQKCIASMYGVDQSLISLIKNNKIW